MEKVDSFEYNVERITYVQMDHIVDVTDGGITMYPENRNADTWNYISDQIGILVTETHGMFAIPDNFDRSPEYDPKRGFVLIVKWDSKAEMHKIAHWAQCLTEMREALKELELSFGGGPQIGTSVPAKSLAVFQQWLEDIGQV